MPVSAAVGGVLDRAAAKRGWPAVVVEVKKQKPARAQTFANVEIDVDADGETLVIEFPSDQRFSMQMADEPEMRELLKRSLAMVFGTPPAFRYQLGRGAVRPAQADEAVVPAPRVPGPNSDPVAEAPAPDVGDIEHLLVHGLGAQIVEEYSHQPDGEDEQ